MKRKILTVNLDYLLSAVCRDDRGYAQTLKTMGLPAEGWEPPFFTCEGMPGDARIIDIRPNCAFAGQIDMLIESDTFEDIPDGRQLPYMMPTNSRFTSYRTYLEMRQKPPTFGEVIEAKKAEGPPADEPKAVQFREFI